MMPGPVTRQITAQDITKLNKKPRLRLLAQTVGVARFRGWAEESARMPSMQHVQVDSEALDYLVVDESSESPEEESKSKPSNWRLFSAFNLSYRGPAELAVFFIWFPNLLFSYLANIVGGVGKIVADSLASVLLGCLVLSSGGMAAAFGVVDITFMSLSGFLMSREWNGKVAIIFSLILSGLLLSILLPLATIFSVVAIPCGIATWLLAQAIYLVVNTINYLRHLFDGITNLFVRIAAIFTWLIIDDQVQYTDVSISIKAILESLLGLAPIALVVAMMFIPFAGPVGAFFTSLFLTVGASVGIPLQLLIGSAIIAGYQFCAGLATPIVRGILNMIFSSEDSVVAYSSVRSDASASSGTIVPSGGSPLYLSRTSACVDLNASGSESNAQRMFSGPVVLGGRRYRTPIFSTRDLLTRIFFGPNTKRQSVLFLDPRLRLLMARIWMERSGLHQPLLLPDRANVPEDASRDARSNEDSGSVSPRASSRKFSNG